MFTSHQLIASMKYSNFSKQFTFTVYERMFLCNINIWLKQDLISKIQTQCLHVVIQALILYLSVPISREMEQMTLIISDICITDYLTSLHYCLDINIYLISKQVMVEINIDKACVLVRTFLHVKRIILASFASSVFTYQQLSLCKMSCRLEF